MKNNLLQDEQYYAIKLKELYLKYGFEEYKLSGLEEYSLYSAHENFLSWKEVAAFNVGGKLLALRPDVTLSVIKNVQASDTKKLFYDEKVYRMSSVGGVDEVRQIGVEVIGGVDDAVQAEILTLIKGTLSAFGESFVVDISHVGIIEGVLKELGVFGEDREQALKCLAEKNLHDFKKLCERLNLSESGKVAVERLITLSPEPKKAIAELKSFLPKSTLCFVEEIERVLKLCGNKNVNINFSAMGNADYYNGLVFKGYLADMPAAILSGGRYDKLVEKFGKSSNAIGFALYFGEISANKKREKPTPDVALLYKSGEEEAAYKKAEKLRGEGKSVVICREVPKGFKGKIIYGGEGND
jgi:ATP phosphoribosyltransferase regulatory subunit